jgi:hypothetical protein
MSESPSSPTRRTLLTAATAAGAATIIPPATIPPAAHAAAGAAKDDVRPFQVQFPDAALTDLRRRAAATNWPTRELVSDASQGVQLATMRKVADYWKKHHDWRKVEARLNARPQFITEIDGLDIHFIHVRSKHPDAMPVIITHGWPGSVIEQLKVIGPLTDPTAHGGKAEDGRQRGARISV